MGYILSSQQLGELEREIALREAKQFKLQEEMMHHDVTTKMKATMSLKDREEFNMTQARMRAEVALNDVEIAGLKTKINLSSSMETLNARRLTYKTRTFNFTNPN